MNEYISDYQKNAYRAWCRSMEESEQFPECFRTRGEQHMARTPIYLLGQDWVRVFIVDLRGNQLSRRVDIHKEDWESRPAADRRTKAEALWAFKICGFTL